MEDPKPTNEPKSEKKSTLPPPLKPKNVLDSIFRDGGIMPPARYGIRSIAFLMDFILVTTVAMLVTLKIAWPQSYPGALFEFNQLIDAFSVWIQSGAAEAGEPAPILSESLAEALVFANNIFFIIFWIYFMIGEAFFRGASIGKHICRLRTVSTVTLGAPPVFTGIVRAGLKTIAILLWFPVSILVSVAFVFFNKRRQLGHDILSRTAVVDERYIQRQS